MMRLVELLLGWQGVLVALALWCGLIALHVCKVTNWNERLQFAVGSGAAFGAVYALFWQVQIGRHNVTNGFMSRWNEIELRTLRHDFSKILRGEIAVVYQPADSAHSLGWAIQGDWSRYHEQRQLITTILNPFEEIGLAVLSGRAEDVVPREYYAGILHKAVTKLEPWIDEQRSLDGQAAAFEYILRLDAHWQQAIGRENRYRLWREKWLYRPARCIRHLSAGIP